MPTFCPWLGEVIAHNGKAEGAPTEAGLEGKEGTLKT